MSGNARYALYYAPAAETPLWRFGSAVLGHDAATGRDLPLLTPDGIAAEAWHELTSEPRRYGFHATLKAPFRIAPGDESGLIAALAAFCADRRPVGIGPLVVSALPAADDRGFVAFVPQSPPAALGELERDVVTKFEPFRLPLSPAEREKRRPERLSVRQRDYLDRYGYPFVLDEFRFHMTLSGPVRNAAAIAARLGAAARQKGCPAELTIDALCLFHQASPDERFSILRRFTFAG